MAEKITSKLIGAVRKLFSGESIKGIITFLFFRSVTAGTLTSVKCLPEERDRFEEVYSFCAWYDSARLQFHSQGKFYCQRGPHCLSPFFVFSSFRLM